MPDFEGRLCLMHNQCLVRCVFDWDCELAATRLNNWAKDAGEVLDESDLQALHRTRLLVSSVSWVTGTVYHKTVTKFEE